MHHNPNQNISSPTNMKQNTRKLHKCKKDGKLAQRKIAKCKVA
jgi:hypothetical protein